MNGRDNRQPGPGLSLPTMVAMHPDPAMWPTPRSEDSQSCGGHRGKPDSLTAAVKLWPTPAASDNRPRATKSAVEKRRAAGKQISLEMQVKYPEGEANPKDSVGQLNPTWVELLMGFPPGWTDLSAA